ncbi:hypothetical protein [uncultured Salinicola sp.]|uniref:hypothetical protein n=1 Tax=uncultured Salinicola sp. TaxID=1193542 RepID=UPI00262FA4C7|nr:hypothetical protein [uncultured Salinicola sp.]|tara:strand:- start:442 stop:681 length:240 start_codon:yes stop_codon:yes gene_type:complete
MKMNTALAAIAMLSLGLSACSDGPDNDQIGEAPPRQTSAQGPTTEPAPVAVPTRVDLPEVPAPSDEDMVLDEVVDGTAG